MLQQAREHPEGQTGQHWWQSTGGSSVGGGPSCWSPCGCTFFPPTAVRLGI